MHTARDCQMPTVTAACTALYMCRRFELMEALVRVAAAKHMRTGACHHLVEATRLLLEHDMLVGGSMVQPTTRSIETLIDSLIRSWGD